MASRAPLPKASPGNGFVSFKAAEKNDAANYGAAHSFEQVKTDPWEGVTYDETTTINHNWVTPAESSYKTHERDAEEGGS